MKAEDFRAWRDQMAFTQPEAAKHLGTTVFTVRAIEQGRQKVPGPIALLIEMYAKGVIRRGWIDSAERTGAPPGSWFSGGAD